MEKNSLQVYTIHYLNAGLSVIPVNKNEKKPLLPAWKEYQKSLPSIADVSAWFQKFRADLCIALICGRVSGNLEIIDFDLQGVLFEQWRQSVEFEAPGLLNRLVIEKTQSGGVHIPYRCTDIQIPGNKKLAFLRIEVNGKGEHQFKGKAFAAHKDGDKWVITPEAIETRGEGGYCIVAPSPGYEQIQGEITNLPIITTAERSVLIDAAHSLNQWVESSRVTTGSQEKRNTTGSKTPGNDFNERGNIIPFLSRHGWSEVKPGLWRRPGKSRGQSASLLDGKIFYVFSSNAAPFESDRGYSKFAVYTLLEHGGNYHEAAKALIKQEYGERDCSGKNMDFILLGDLLNEPDEKVEWLVENMLPQGGFSAWVAKPKVGKSTLVRNLSLKVAQGESFLGKNIVQGPVVYLALEEKRSEVRKHFRDMGASGTEQIHIYASHAPVDALIQLQDAVRRIKPALVVIDPLFRLTRVRDGNDYAQMTQALEPILVLARETGTHIAVVHHAGKGERQGGDSILGSTAIFASVDTAVIMKKTERYRTIQTIQRYGQDLEETTLCFDAATRTTELGQSREIEDMTRIEGMIFDVLSSQEHPLTEPEIMTEIEGTNALKRKALRSLLKQERIERHGKGGKGDPFRYYCTLVRSISVVQEYENKKSDVSLDKNEDNSCTDILRKNEKPIVQAFPLLGGDYRSGVI